MSVATSSAAAERGLLRPMSRVKQAQSRSGGAVSVGAVLATLTALNVVLLRAATAINLSRLRAKHFALNAGPLPVGRIKAHAAPALRASALTVPRPTRPD